jgi:hypothetical protein
MTTTHSAAGGPDGTNLSLTTSSSYYTSISSQSGSGLKHIDLQEQPTSDASLQSIEDSNVDPVPPISKWADAVLSSALSDISSENLESMLRYVGI